MNQRHPFDFWYARSCRRLPHSIPAHADSRRGDDPLEWFMRACSPPMRGLYAAQAPTYPPALPQPRSMWRRPDLLQLVRGIHPNTYGNKCIHSDIVTISIGYSCTRIPNTANTRRASRKFASPRAYNDRTTDTLTCASSATCSSLRRRPSIISRTRHATACGVGR